MAEFIVEVDDNGKSLFLTITAHLNEQEQVKTILARQFGYRVLSICLKSERMN
mgnify:CR=1 FL=1